MQVKGDGDFKVTFENDVAIITMCKGENKINIEFIEQMCAALDKVLENPAVKTVVTTGQGRFYSNGFDLKWIAELGLESTLNFMRKYSQMLAKILTFPLTTVAAVNGHAYAGAALISLAHDHVIMQTDRGWWCMNEVHLNLKIPYDLLGLLKEKLSSGQTVHEVVVLGKRYTAKEALRCGIVHEICAPTDLMPTVFSWINNNLPKAGYDREHLQTMKEDLYKDTVVALKAKL